MAVIRSRIQKLAVAMLVLSRAVWEHSRQLRWLTLRSEDACTLQLAPELKGVVLEGSLTIPSIRVLVSQTRDCVLMWR